MIAQKTKKTEEKNIMAKVTQEQIRMARDMDLLTYLQLYEPDELVRVNANEYRTKTHGSLVISNGKWYYNRGGFGGVSALDYLVKVRRMAFVSAVEVLCGIRDSYAYYSQPPNESARPPPKRDFILPKAVKYPEKMVAYIQKRGITPEIISHCMKRGILYESVHNNKAVCVFVGYDENHTVRYATMRGIDSDIKQDVFGSDKRWSFSFPDGNAGNTDLICFESPIDLLSYIVLENRDCYKLSLGGVSTVALIAFLERHREIQHIVLGLDSDAAGQEAAKKIQWQLAADSRFAHLKVTINPPLYGKDYNEMLMQKNGLEREQKSINKNKNILL